MMRYRVVRSKIIQREKSLHEIFAIYGMCIRYMYTHIDTPMNSKYEYMVHVKDLIMMYVYSDGDIHVAVCWVYT